MHGKVRSRRCLGVPTALALASLALTAGCGSADQLAVDDVVASPRADLDGTTLSIVVPIGTLDVEVGTPVSRLGDLRAPDGGSLVQLSTTFHSAQVRKDVWRFAGRSDATEPIELQLGVGDQTYDVGTVRDGDASPVLPHDVVVALSEDAAQTDDLRVDVGYDGLVQSVGLDGERDPGPADALYDDSRAASPTRCTDVRLDHGIDSSAALCRVDRVDRLPYLPDLGWAEEGRTWVAVSLAAALDDVSVGDAETPYSLASVRNRSTLGAAPTLTVLDATDEITASGWTGTLVFDAPARDAAGAARIRLDLGLRSADDPLASMSAAPGPLLLTAAAPLRRGARTTTD